MRQRLKGAIKSRFPAVVRVRDLLRGGPTRTDGEPPSPSDAAPESPGATPAGDVITVFSRAEVEALMDELVRPALEADGGNIELVRVDRGDVHVRLVGACVGCPSSRMTLHGGVERLLAEELVGFGALIEAPAA